MTKQTNWNRKTLLQSLKKNVYSTIKGGIKNIHICKFACNVIEWFNIQSNNRVDAPENEHLVSFFFISANQPSLNVQIWFSRHHVVSQENRCALAAGPRRVNMWHRSIDSNGFVLNETSLTCSQLRGDPVLHLWRQLYGEHFSKRRQVSQVFSLFLRFQIFFLFLPNTNLWLTVATKMTDLKTHVGCGEFIPSFKDPQMLR